MDFKRPRRWAAGLFQVGPVVLPRPLGDAPRRGVRAASEALLNGYPVEMRPSPPRTGRAHYRPALEPCEDNQHPIPTPVPAPLSHASALSMSPCFLFLRGPAESRRGYKEASGRPRPRFDVEAGVGPLHALRLSVRGPAVALQTEGLNRRASVLGPGSCDVPARTPLHRPFHLSPGDAEKRPGDVGAPAPPDREDLLPFDGRRRPQLGPRWEEQRVCGKRQLQRSSPPARDLRRLPHLPAQPRNHRRPRPYGSFGLSFNEPDSPCLLSAVSAHDEPPIASSQSHKTCTLTSQLFSGTETE
ncbi:hypothetical protein AAFF_G00171900 [Aldrovandia affinis]|uniref:Uncharacterized protein n=1 Tax=Aldrovandia affinis TaxID=143900 RepID=A0AAD7SYN8_9TELE|nr:hypothetical protein AAFF_G00171900 [Aldrovandia affinis]